MLSQNHGADAAGIAGVTGAGVAAWLAPETLTSLAELNEFGLAVLAEQAAARAAQPSLLLRQIGELWGALDRPARRRAAACPYLLLDAGFADPGRWRARPDPGAPELGVGDGARDGAA